MHRTAARAMLVGGGVPSLVTTVALVLGAALMGPGHMRGALIGAATGMVAMALPPVVLLVTGRWSVHASAGAGVATYGVVVFEVLLVREFVIYEESIESATVGLSLGLVVFVWSLGLMRAMRTARIPIFDPPHEETGRGETPPDPEEEVQQHPARDAAAEDHGRPI